MLQEEKGSSLLLVVFMILLLSMLGIAVLGASLGGAQLSQRTEDNVQSLHLAEKALDEAVAYIYANFDNKDSIEPESLGETLDAFAKQLTAEIHSNNAPWASDTLDKSSDYSIDSITYEGPGNQSADTGNNTNFALKITAHAVVAGATRTLEREVVLDTFPDFLKYAFGSESNVIINGSPLFKGNVYSGRDILINNKASYYYNDMPRQWGTNYFYMKPSANPYPSPDNETDGYMVVPSVDSVKYKDNIDNVYMVLDGSQLASDPSLQENGLSRIRIRDKKKFVSINVEESFLDKVYEAAGGTSGSPFPREQLQLSNEQKSTDIIRMLIDQYSGDYQNGDNKTFRMLEMPIEPEAVNPIEGETDEEYNQRINTYNQQFDEYTNELTKFNDRLLHLQGAFIFDGTLTLDGKALQGINFQRKDKNDWLIVNGDLIIDNPKDAVALILRGNILVTGNIRFSGALRVDATIYALGDKPDQTNEIVDASIRGIQGAGDDGAPENTQLVLIAQGPIDIYRIDSFGSIGAGYDSDEDKINVLDAFFYTDKSAELYGVGSYLWINGGFFSKEDLIINAVLGNTTENEAQTDLNFDDQSRLDYQQARFVIDYSSDVFSGQHTGLPRVKTLRLTTGPLKLVSSTKETGTGAH